METTLEDAQLRQAFKEWSAQAHEAFHWVADSIAVCKAALERDGDRIKELTMEVETLRRSLVDMEDKYARRPSGPPSFGKAGNQKPN